MSFSILSPLIYLLIGFILGRFPIELKNPISAVLTKLVIPFVIVYNIAIPQSGAWFIMIGIILIMFSMLILSNFFTKDPIKKLCFFYLNIGWLGLPIAESLFGDSATMIIIAAYIGSSLFGNAIGAGLMIQGKSVKTSIRETLQAPSILALLVGLGCLPFQNQIAMMKPIYDILKMAMSVMGMMVLGIWLSSAKITIADFKAALLPFFMRLLTIFILISLFITIAQYYHIALVLNNQPTLYLLCLLPPAANIIVLETHYMKSGRSATMIACGTCLSVLAIILYIAVIASV